MYAWMFRSLPGPTWVKAILAVIIVAAVIVVLFQWVFPAIAPFMPFNDGLVGMDDPSVSTDPSPPSA